MSAVRVAVAGVLVVVGAVGALVGAWAAGGWPLTAMLGGAVALAVGLLVVPVDRGGDGWRDGVPGRPGGGG